MHLLIENLSSFFKIADALIFDADAISNIALTIASPVAFLLRFRPPEAEGTTLTG
jgi:hypothetical protein